MRLAIDAETSPEPRIRPLKPPAKKTAARKAAAKTNAAAPRSKAPARPKAITDPPPVSLPDIPPELLAASPKPSKPRKPRGKKPATSKPQGALDLILSQLDDAKAEQIVTIPLDSKAAVADAMVVASGRSNRHVGAIADQLVQKLKEKGYRDLRIEGMPQCDWVLVDAGDVVVHIFRPEVRSFYNLEKLWSANAPAAPPVT
ncbi:MAG: ribosome silencing factor [Aestuariivirga sp.]|jgi:ribosome-associated protein|uniref:ribosome silencing factor n=1 Tax=Aestuariivirga sp. TaxID=2650926 RepID=UPI0038D05905